MGFLAFIFLFVIVLLILVLSVVGRLLGGVLSFLGLGRPRRTFSSYGSSGGRMEGNSEQTDDSASQSEVGAKRMRVFKSGAEDVDFEEEKE